MQGCINVGRSFVDGLIEFWILTSSIYKLEGVCLCQGFLQQSHFPIFGNEKCQPIPTSGILFLNQFPKMGTKVSTNSQCGKIQFNQFPVSNGNKIFSQFPVGKIKFNQFPVLLECQRKRLIPLGISWRTKSQIWEQIFQSIPSGGNSCGNQFPLWE